jgi:Holliday junction resolvase-like predicted endonuclease
MAEEKKFISINAMALLRNERRLVMSTIDRNDALLEFDSAIINPEFFLQTYRPEGYYKDIPKLNWNDSRRIVEKYDKVRRQLNDMLKQGKNIYVLVGFSNKCYRYTGKTDVLGQPSGVALFDLYSFLPIKISLESMRGSCFELANPEFKDFFLSIKNSVEYHSVISGENVIPFLKIKGTDEIVGAFVPHHNGKIVFLPSFNQEFYAYGKDGDILRQNVFNSIYSLDASLTRKEVVEYPEWIDNYNILTETDDIKQLNNLENEKNELLKQIEKQKNRLDILKKYKGLFTSTGHQLENIVKEVLAEIGFKILPSDSRRSDVIAQYENQDVVIEVKGIKKSATEEYARQLEAWNSDFWTETKKVAKCILVVNGFLDKKLEERKEPVFPDAMLKYCIGHEQCLITTTQLLCLFIEITDNPDCKDERVKELLNTVGIYNRYTDYTPFIKKVK